MGVTNYLIDALIGVSVVALIIYGYLTRNYGYWRRKNIKYAKPSFPFGNVGSCVFAKKSPQDKLLDIYNEGKGEKVFGFHVMDKPYLMIRDPDLLRHIFIKDFNNFSNKIVSGNDNDTLGSTNLFLAKNPPWKFIRQKLTPVFTSGKLKKMFDLMMEIVTDFENYLDNLKIDVNKGQVVEVKELCAQLTTDIIGTTAFGLKFNSLTDPNAAFRKYGRAMFRSTYKRYLQMMSIFFIPALRPITNPKFFDDKGSEFLKQTFWHVIDERIRTGIKRADLIDLLIDIKNNQENDNTDSYKLEGDALVAQAAVFFTGGFESSSTTMSFCLFELAQYPEIQKKLRDELLEGLAKTNGIITYDMIGTLPYLDMVIHEALRMYPVLPWLDRLPENDYTFPGTDITVKKGTPLILPMRAMHMDPNYFPNPEKFVPERFAEENKKNIVPFTFYPFGEGPRNCIGARLGLIQTKLGIIHIISRYEVTLSKETIMPMKLDRLSVFTHSPGGLYLNFKSIQTSK